MDLFSTPERTLNIFALGLIFIGFIVYCYILIVNWDYMSHKNNLSEILRELFSHLDIEKSSPFPHICAGLFFLSGTSILIGELISIFLLGSQHDLSTRLALSGILVGIMFSFVSLWTLWQTRRIAYNSGFVFTDLQKLTSFLNQEITDIVYSYRDFHKRKATPRHRFLLITTQPLFGSLTRFGDQVAEEFEKQLRSLSKCVSESEYISESSEKPAHKFKFEIICGSQNCISEFHKLYVGNDREQLNLLDDKIENFIADLQRESNIKSGVVFRKEKIPPVQFAIVGNKVITFNLNPESGTSHIFEANVHQDVKHVNAYLETFEFLRESL